MSGIDYLADTNALVYLLNGNACMEPYLTSKMGYSVISEMEVLSFPEIQEDEEKTTREFLSRFTLFLLPDSVVERTISLRRKYRIKLPDAIIAATAIEIGVPLLTADLGFRKIAELQLELLTPK